VRLIAVTKTYPTEDVLHLAALGVGDVGENRDQEAAPKAAAAAAAGADLTWHFIGQLQRNKARSVARYAAWVHSVDRPELADALSRARAATDAAPLDVLVQVSLDGQVHRGGVVPADVPALADRIAAAPALRLAGVMAVAPLDAAGDELVRAFAALARTSEAIRRIYPDAIAISAGMSGDLELAVAHGATHVRIGSALLGTRPKLR